MVALFENVTFKPAEKRDIPGIVSLMNSHYVRKITESYFHWQYFDSRFHAVSMCAFADDELIGITGIRTRELRSGINTGFAMDAIVAPEWRGTRLAQIIAERAMRYYENIDLLCALPNQHWKNFCVRRLGWKNVSRIHSMILDRIDFEGIERKPLNRCISCAEDRAFERFKYDDEIRKWRFDRHPRYVYNYVKLKTGEFAVTKIFEDSVTGKRYGDIVDFECNLNARSLLGELFVKACIYLSEQNVKSITTWALPHTPLRVVIESLGFVELRQERYFCMKVLRPEYEYLYDLSHWHLVQADAEIY
jgi:hypothetical protein